MHLHSSSGGTNDNPAQSKTRSFIGIDPSNNSSGRLCVACLSEVCYSGFAMHNDVEVCPA